MKTLSIVPAKAGELSYLKKNIGRPFYVIRATITLLLMQLLSVHVLSAQDIILQNPSLEGKPRTGAPPSPWFKCSQSPDTQPGYFGVTLPASDGATYVGVVYGTAFRESFSQHISGLKGGKTYSVSFDLARPTFYYNYDVCQGSFAIYGGNFAGDTTELLWESGLFSHTDWKRYTAVFTPTKDYKYILFAPYKESNCSEKRYTVALVDNFSPAIREVPQVEVSVRNACKDGNTGMAEVAVKNQTGSYTYSWQPGNYNGPVVKGLQSGKYEVTVTGENGASTVARVEVGEYEVQAKATITGADCYDGRGEISLKASGGPEPYTFSIDNGATFNSVPSFKNLAAGYYDIIVEDAARCQVTLDSLQVEQPMPLSIAAQLATPVSCSSVRDGQLTITPQGGTPPYSYVIQGGATQQDNTFRQLDAGTYQFLVTDHHDCRVSGSGEITKEWRDCAVFMPNAFSPNGDGINDIFRAKMQDAVTAFRLAVYGRWGQLIFETDNPNTGWDGSQKGAGMPSGSYLWVVTYTDSKQQPIKQQGTLVLVR